MNAQNAFRSHCSHVRVDLVAPAYVRLFQARSRIFILGYSPLRASARNPLRKSISPTFPGELFPTGELFFTAAPAWGTRAKKSGPKNALGPRHLSHFWLTKNVFPSCIFFPLFRKLKFSRARKKRKSRNSAW